MKGATIRAIGCIVIFLFFMGIENGSAGGKKEQNGTTGPSDAAVPPAAEVAPEDDEGLSSAAVSFGDVLYTPEQLINQALVNNQELLGLRSEKEASAIEVKKAKAERFPTFDFQANFSYITNPPTLELKPGDLGSMQTEAGKLEFPQEKMEVNLGAQNTNYEFKLIVDQPVFTWGKITNAVKLYEQGTEAGRLSVLNKENEITVRIKSYLHSLYFLDKIEALIQKQKETAERLIFISEKSYESGFIIYTELLDTRVRVKEIDLAQAQLREQKNQVLIQLKQTTGLEDLPLGSIDFTFIDENIDHYHLSSKEALIEKALNENLNLQLLKKQQEIARHKLKIAKGKSYLKPDIGLHFELTYGGAKFPFIEPDWFGTDDYNITSTIGLTTTIFDGGRLRSDVKINEEELQGTLYDYGQGVNSVRQLIAQTLLKIDLNRHSVEYYNLKYETDKEQTDLKKTQFDSGAGSERDYLQAKIDLYADEIQIYKEKISFFNNYFTIKNITGDPLSK